MTARIPQEGPDRPAEGSVLTNGRQAPVGAGAIADLVGSPLYSSSSSRVVSVRGGAPCDVYVGRRTRTHQGSPWGNPHPLAANSTRARASSVLTYAHELAAGRFGTQDDLVGALAGRTLGCWCAPLLCHGHPLAILVNAGEVALTTFIHELESTAAAMPYRLLVTGSRDWSDEVTVANALFDIWAGWGRPSEAVLVAGGASGADEIAARLWSRAGLRVETHPAEWELHGRRAGMIRNAQMVASGVDHCVAFSRNDSPGTKQCMTAAQKAGIPTSVHRSV